MGVWDIYTSRIEAHGATKRGATLAREKRFLNSNLPNSLSYHNALIDDISQNVAIIDTDNLDTKFIYSLPGETIRHGGLVQWMGGYWLITELDANAEIYYKAKMIQCNYLLRWVDDEDIVHQQWCIIEDGTKLRIISFRIARAVCKNIY